MAPLHTRPDPWAPRDQTVPIDEKDGKVMKSDVKVAYFACFPSQNTPFGHLLPAFARMGPSPTSSTVSLAGMRRT